ncbi:hypothetical protein ACFLV7_14345 [Chloroflexota bacterium]
MQAFFGDGYIPNRHSGSNLRNLVKVIFTPTGAQTFLMPIVYYDMVEEISGAAKTISLIA